MHLWTVTYSRTWPFPRGALDDTKTQHVVTWSAAMDEVKRALQDGDRVTIAIVSATYLGVVAYPGQHPLAKNEAVSTGVDLGFKQGTQIAAKVAERMGATPDVVRAIADLQPQG